MPLGLSGGGRTPPFGQLLGPGLDARLFTDLSTLSADKPDTLVTPTDRFFVRTAAPAALPVADWKLGVGGLAASPLDLDARALESMTERGGRYLLECSGNVDQSNYGLMSTADWDGVPLERVLERARPAAATHRVLVSGVDHEASAARTSVPGASWTFARADLGRALLATRMNGAPLPARSRRARPPHRSWLVRLRVHQVGQPHRDRGRRCAGDDADAGVRGADASGSAIAGARPRLRAGRHRHGRDAGARREMGRSAAGSFYRVVGIIWGGSKPTNALSIRFKSGEPWVRVENCPLPSSTLTWSLWSHTWRPQAPGRYQIVLKVDDPSIRTRRLDIFFYVREVDIDEI